MYMPVWKVYVYAWFASGYHACVYLFEGHVYACFTKAGKHMLDYQPFDVWLYYLNFLTEVSIIT